MRLKMLLRHGLLAMLMVVTTLLVTATLSGAVMAQGKLDIDMTVVDYAGYMAMFPKGTDVRTKPYYDKAFEAMAHGYRDAQLSILSAAIERFPKTSGWAYNNRGLIRDDRKEYELAIADYTAGIAIDPKLTVLYVNRGIAWAKKGNLDKAVEDFNASIRIDAKGSSGAYINRALVTRAKKGNLDEAIADLDRVLANDPTYSSAYVLRAVMWRDKGDLERALSDLNEAVRRDKDDFEALNNRAIVWAELGDLRMALTDANAAVEKGVAEKERMAMTVRGQIYQRMGDKAKALADYKEALRQNDKYGYTDMRMRRLADKIRELGGTP